MKETLVGCGLQQFIHWTEYKNDNIAVGMIQKRILSTSRPVLSALDCQLQILRTDPLSALETQ